MWVTLDHAYHNSYASEMKNPGHAELEIEMCGGPYSLLSASPTMRQGLTIVTPEVCWGERGTVPALSNWR